MLLIRRVLLVALTVVGLSPMGVAAEAPAPTASDGGDPRPSIVFILADDLGYECVGAYGGESYGTPHIDRLARDGLRFTSGFSTPKCSPSRVTFLTGRYTFRTTREWGHLPPGEVTVAQMLRAAGYATAVAGKWQLGLLKDDPERIEKAGFTESCCWGWHEGPRYWKPTIYQNGRILEGIKERYGPDVYREFLVDFIERHRDRPFFAYYSMCLAHWPKPDEPPGPRGRYETFQEMVEEMDRQVGKLVDALDRLQLRQRTLIVFTGDNGSPRNVVSTLDGREVRGGKATLTDRGTRVPLIASWRETIPRGGVCDDLVDFSDLFPTFLEIAGVRSPEGVTLDGQSFAFRLLGREGHPRSWIFTEWEGSCWVRDGRWKLYGDGRLFDMTADASEETPLSPGDLVPEAARARTRLQSVLDRLLKADSDSDTGRSGRNPYPAREGAPRGTGS